MTVCAFAHGSYKQEKSHNNMGESLLTWNVPNFISVLLMVSLGILVFGFLSKAYRTQKGS